jgi:hypothetical protein
MSLSSIFQSLRSGRIKLWDTISNLFGGISRKF